MRHWMWTLAALLTGFILDLIFGDPHKMPHFVRLMGNTITGAEKLLRKLFSSKEKLAGFFLVVIMMLLYGALPCVVFCFLYSWNAVAGFVIESFVCYQMLAAKSLKAESMKVYEALAAGNLLKARENVSMIVGRDTQSLDETGITRAAVETVAENTSDGVVAPLFYLAIGGGWLGMAYKAVNTMDSMVGYRNERYERFGFFAAKLDDIVNFIPARIAAGFMIIAAFLLGMDGLMAGKIFCRDRHNHKSPNSAQTESVCAGALNVRLAGNAYYFGKLYEKPYIGDNIREIEPEDINRANKLMYGTALLALIIFCSVKWIIGMRWF